MWVLLSQALLVIPEKLNRSHVHCPLSYNSKLDPLPSLSWEDTP